MPAFPRANARPSGQYGFIYREIRDTHSLALVVKGSLLSSNGLLKFGFILLKLFDLCLELLILILQSLEFSWIHTVVLQKVDRGEVVSLRGSIVVRRM